MKIEIECGNCHEKIKTENHCAISACFHCGCWVYQSGEPVNWEERHKLYEETYFGEDK